MRALAVLAHPSQTSFAAQIYAEAVTALKDGGHEVRTLDLYGEGFEARLSEPEWKTNAEVPENRKPVAALVEDLLWAEALILVFPTWWSGMPAILKGWLDRVFLPGVAFDLADGPIRARLTRLRVFAAITTAGSAWWQVLALFDPVRVHLRAMRLSVAPQAKPVFLRLYKMDTVTAAGRQSFLVRVRERMRTLA